MIQFKPKGKDSFIVTDAINDYTEEKMVKHLSKFFKEHEEVQLSVLYKVRPHKEYEVVGNLFFGKVVLHASSRSKDMYASIVEVTEKLERQIVKRKYWLI